MAIWCQCFIFCVSFLLRLLVPLKCQSQSCENPYQNHQTKTEKVTKKYTYLREIILRQCPVWGTGFVGHSQTNVIKFCRWSCRINIFVLIWLSVVWFCFVLVSTSFSPLVLTVMLLSLLMFGILVKIQLLPRVFGLWTGSHLVSTIHLVQGDWELLSGELIVILLRMA